jgi:type I restriction enzyme S subunit
MRDGWTRVAFGDIVRLSRERTSDPPANGFDRYVGLEHLDPGDLKIRRWGNVADGTTFTNVFRPGQVLFGKRRAYQRKVAIADFSGVCSGDIYVLEPADPRLAPELLPLICESDAFFEHAVATSAGSLSPRTSWDRLAAFELDLPPSPLLDRYAALCDAVVSVRHAHRVSVDKGSDLRRTTLLSTFRGCLSTEALRDTLIGPLPRSWAVEKLQDRYEVQLGKRIAEKELTGDAVVPYIRNANVQWDTLDLADVKTVLTTASEREFYALRPGDILACEGRHVGKSAIWTGEIGGAIYQMALHRLRARSDRDVPEFMLGCLEYYSMTGRLAADTAETTIPHLSAERFRVMLFPFPPRTEQERIARLIRSAAEAVRIVDTRLSRVSDLSRRAVDELVVTK